MLLYSIDISQKGDTMANYDKIAVDKAIATSKKPISKKEAKLIHALLKGNKK